MTELLPGRVAVVTGAAQGIGFSLARAFAQRRMRVVLADIARDELESARVELAADGSEVFAVRTDVSSADSVFALAEATLDRFGDVDIVCNNAGVGGDFGPVWSKETTEWERTIAVHVWGVIHGIRAFVPHLVARNKGHVVNTASMAGLTVRSGQIGDFAMAKFAVVGLTESLSKDLEAHAPGVKATLLCPGVIRTPLSDRQFAKLEAAAAAGGGGLRWNTPLEPSEAAAVTLHAIEADLLYAVPARNPYDALRDRFERITRELSQQGHALGS